MNGLPEHPKLNRLFRMQWEAVQQAYVLLYPEGMVKLNQSAAEILKRCDGTHTISDIVTSCEAAFSTTGLQDQIVGMLQTAFEKDWIV